MRRLQIRRVWPQKHHAQCSFGTPPPISWVKIHTRAIAFLTEALLWKPWVKKTGAFAPVVSDDLAQFLPENPRRFDAIVMNNSSGPWITPTESDLAKPAFQRYGTDPNAVEQVLRQSLLGFVRNGGGIVSLHYAIAANPQWLEFKELLGGTFIGHPWNEEIGVTVEEPQHALLAAFQGKDFCLADEIYEYGTPYDRSQLRILLSLDPACSNMGCTAAN